MKPVRMALLSPEFVCETDDRGGLASYLLRLAKAMVAMGHQPEIFTLGRSQSVVEHAGVRVEHVGGWDDLSVRLVRKMAHWLPGQAPRFLHQKLWGAWALAQALERRELQEPFDLVQSSNFGLAGFFVRRKDRRVHLMRCSSSRLLWKSVGRDSVPAWVRWLDRLERRSMRRADAVYAPSAFLADHFKNEHGLKVHVVRPPLEMDPAVVPSALPAALPNRFLLHFGLLGPRKGTDGVVQALDLALKAQPDIQVVMAGAESEPGYMQAHRVAGGPVHWLGPVPRDRLGGVIQHAVASVLPSRVDNLPNTVLESLSLGTPVIGTRGASIDEVVEDGRNGRLVAIDDLPALAEAMVEAWRAKAAWTDGRDCAPVEAGAFESNVAVANLLHLAKTCKPFVFMKGHRAHAA